MFELHIADTNITSGSVPVSWCVSQDTLDLLAKIGVKKPMVMIVTIDYKDTENLCEREHRKLVPLKDLMTYVTFHSEGKNDILAFICVDPKHARNMLMRSYYGYKHYAIHKEYTGASNDEFHFGYYDVTQCGFFKSPNLSPLLFATPLSVDVPKEVFAPPPAKWEQEWLSWLLSTDRNDQCDFRRKRLFGYTIQPVLMVLYLLMRFFFTFWAFMFAMRGSSFKYLLHPLTYDNRDMFGGLYDGGTYAIGRGDNQFLNWIRLPLMPIVVSFFVLMYFVHALVGTLIVLGFIVGLAALTIGVGFLMCLFVTKRRVALEKAEPWYLKSDEANLVLCGGTNKFMKPGDLPSSRRTLRLRFLDLKAKVCRPYSR